MYPEKLWDYNYIAGNPNTTREYILEHYLGVGLLSEEIKPNQYLMVWMSQNVNIGVEDVLAYPNLHWDSTIISWNRNFSLDDIITLIMSGISEFRNQYFMTNFFIYYSNNPRLTQEDLRTYHGVWDWNFVLGHSWITKDMLNEKSELPITGFSRNPNLTMDMVLNNSDIYTRTSDVSINPGITWEDIVNNPEYPWDWKYVSGNPNITLEIVLNNPKAQWNWRELSTHPNITWEMIMDNPDLPWNKRCVSLNPNITWDIIRDNPEWPWDWRHLSLNGFTKHNRR